MNEVVECPECGKTDLIHDDDAGELVCQSCGYVVSSTLIDKGPEWRAFNLEQKQNRPRTGAPLTLTKHDKGLSTVIGWRGRDARGRRLKPKRRDTFYRLRKWHRRSKVSGSTQRSLSYALGEMTKVTDKLGLPRNVLETASMIYRRAVRKGMIKGRSIQTVVAACLYIACRQCRVVRTLEEIAEASNVAKKTEGKVYRYILRKLDVDVPLYTLGGHISKFVNRLGLSGGTERVATSLADLASQLRLTSGRGTSSIAAACVYISSKLNGEGRTQNDIARAADVTEVTIRNRYKEIVKSMNISLQL